jgi:hypothetical protein
LHAPSARCRRQPTHTPREQAANIIGAHNAGIRRPRRHPECRSTPAARYRDLGPDWHARHTDRSRKARNAQRQLEALGYDVINTPRQDAA